MSLRLHGAPRFIRDYADPYVELVALLYEASNIEHALLVQYLAAAFSLKPAYLAIAGSGMTQDAFSLFGVAIQEMQHLHTVNRLLVTLGTTPRLDRQDFPIETAIYPFPLEIRPLSDVSLARYAYAEAPAAVFDPSAPPSDQSFATRVLAILGHAHVNHIGSLYTTILARLAEVISAPPAGVGDLSEFPELLEGIKEQGEGAHYQFFRSLLEGTAPGLGGVDTWKDPSSSAYPSLSLRHGLTAFDGAPKTIPDASARSLAWLSDLHYWLTLMLLDLSYRFGNDDYFGVARTHMIGPLFHLGSAVAHHGYCLPFDQPTLPLPWSQTEQNCRMGVSKLARETSAYAQQIATLLPTGYTSAAVDSTLDLLKP